MFEGIYNWFLNSFVRIDPTIKAWILIGLFVFTLLFLQQAFKKSNAKSGDKLKDWKISYFILSGVSMLLALLILIL